MEQLEAVTQLFGVSIANLAFIAGFSYVIVEWLKKKFDGMFVAAWVAQGLSLAVCLGLAFKFYGTAWEQFAVAGVLSWLAADALNAVKTNK